MLVKQFVSLINTLSDLDIPRPTKKIFWPDKTKISKPQRNSLLPFNKDEHVLVLVQMS